jgi:hypothetical protein
MPSQRSRGRQQVRDLFPLSWIFFCVVFVFVGVAVVAVVVVPQ